MYNITQINTNLKISLVPDLDKERPLTIPHLHDWRKMEVFLINFNKARMMRCV